MTERVQTANGLGRVLVDLEDYELRKRFWAKVDFGSGGKDDCWIWTAGTTHGYGSFSGSSGYRQGTKKRKQVQAHVAAYSFFYGRQVRSETLDHVDCVSKLCVRPIHLEEVSQSVNATRAAIKPRESCVKGHPMLGENLYTYPSGNRECRSCVQWRNSASNYARPRDKAQAADFRRYVRDFLPKGEESYLLRASERREFVERLWPLFLEHRAEVLASVEGYNA